MATSGCCLTEPYPLTGSSWADTRQLVSIESATVCMVKFELIHLNTTQAKASTCYSLLKLYPVNDYDPRVSGAVAKALGFLIFG